MVATSTSSYVKRLGLLLILASVTTGDAMGQVVSDKPTSGVVVDVVSGRRFVGEVDPDTNESTLWLRRDLASGYLLRPIDWQRVTSVELGGDAYSGEEFRKALSVVREALASESQQNAALGKPSGQGSIILGPAAATTQIVAPHADEPARVQSLAIDAYLANWDADVEPDGLILDVLPLDSEGALVPVHATVEVDLLAERTGVVKLAEPFARIGRWTRRVDPADFGVWGARYRLAFQAVNPDFDRRWATHGALHVRLSVPGAGVFEQTDSTLRIRPYSSVRDRLEQANGNRYFYEERTGSGKR